MIHGCKTQNLHKHWRNILILSVLSAHHNEIWFLHTSTQQFTPLGRRPPLRHNKRPRQTGRVHRRQRRDRSQAEEQRAQVEAAQARDRRGKNFEETQDPIERQEHQPRWAEEEHISGRDVVHFETQRSREPAGGREGGAEGDEERCRQDTGTTILGEHRGEEVFDS